MTAVARQKISLVVDKNGTLTRNAIWRPTELQD
jgi:hypothetical protein